MFTGLVEAVSHLQSRAPLTSGERMKFSHSFENLGLGESIAVNGACLTVVAFDDSSFEVELSEETLALTNLGALAPFARVNLERALRAGDRLGGHMVTGHVDGLATLSGLEERGDMLGLSLTIPLDLAGFVARKGSLTVDGVSLTVNQVSGCIAELLLIPHTQEVTTLKGLKVGQRFNIEVDLVARYVERLLQAREFTA